MTVRNWETYLLVGVFLSLDTDDLSCRFDFIGVVLFVFLFEDRSILNLSWFVHAPMESSRR